MYLPTPFKNEVLQVLNATINTLKLTIDTIEDLLFDLHKLRFPSQSSNHEAREPVEAGGEQKSRRMLLAELGNSVTMEAGLYPRKGEKNG